MTDPNNDGKLDARFYELLQRYGDDALDSEQATEFNEILDNNEAARDAFVSFCVHVKTVHSTHRTETLAELPVPTPSRHSEQATSGKSSSRKFAMIAAALAASVLLVVGIWNFNQPPIDVSGGANGDPKVTLVKLVDGWEITPTGDAEFEIVKPNLVRLAQGELHVQSLPVFGQRKKLIIETPTGTAEATETEFLVGFHRLPSQFEKTKPRRNPTDSDSKTNAEMAKGNSMQLSSVARVLVLSGVVTLANTLGSIQCNADILGATVDGGAPTKTVVSSNNDFANDLYGQLAKENQGENLFFSPYSISNALAMAAEGARGQTAQQMGDVLRFPEEAKRIGDDAQLIPWRTSLIHTGLAALNDRLNSVDDTPEATAARKKLETLRANLVVAKAKTKTLSNTDKWKETIQARGAEQAIIDELLQVAKTVDQYEVRVANSLWADKTHPFKQEYLDVINGHYKTGGVFPVDFKNNAQAARKVINSWVEGQTKNRIENLVPEGSVNDQTALVLVNAIYFKGGWATPFLKRKTQEKDFTTIGGELVKKQMMQAVGLGNVSYAAFNADGSVFDTPTHTEAGKKLAIYPDADGFSMVELPYKGNELSMVVIAPNSAKQFSELESTFQKQSVTDWLKNLKPRKTNVHLPKFKSETTYTLGDSADPATLQKMGMVRAFVDPRKKDGAQFNGMSHAVSPDQALSISKVLHKAFIEVNEEGTEAAAATATMQDDSEIAPTRTPFVPTFIADRPFIYLVRDRASGAVLFLGRTVK